MYASRRGGGRARTPRWVMSRSQHSPHSPFLGALRHHGRILASTQICGCARGERVRGQNGSAPGAEGGADEPAVGSHASRLLLHTSMVCTPTESYCQRGQPPQSCRPCRPPPVRRAPPAPPRSEGSVGTVGGGNEGCLRREGRTRTERKERAGTRAGQHSLLMCARASVCLDVSARGCLTQSVSRLCSI